MKIFEKAKYIIIRPNQFFEDLEHENDIKKSVLYSISFSIYYLVIFLLIKLLLGEGMKEIGGNYYKSDLIYILYAFFGWLATFIHAAIAHVWIKLFGGKGSYVKTYQLVVYTGTPGYLYGWIPVIGNIISFFHSIILSIVGVQKTHKVSTKRAIILNTIPILIILIVLIIFYLQVYIDMRERFGA